MQSEKYNYANIFNLLNASFNDDGLNTFCMIHFYEVFNNFASGQTKQQRIRDLFDFCIKKLQVEQLLELMQTEFREQYDARKPYTSADYATVKIPPQKLYLSKLPLYKTPVIGRESELKMLDEAWETPLCNVRTPE